MDFMALLPWEPEGITSPCSLLIGQYRYHMTSCHSKKMLWNSSIQQGED